MDLGEINKDEPTIEFEREARLNEIKEKVSKRAADIYSIILSDSCNFDFNCYPLSLFNKQDAEDVFIAFNELVDLGYIESSHASNFFKLAEAFYLGKQSEE